MQPVDLKELLDLREKLIELINSGLTSSEKDFLLFFKNKQPKWELLGLEGMEQFPAIKWKQVNLANMSVEKHTVAYKKLRELLLG